MRAKTVVIGGGVIGCAVALKIAKQADALREPVVLLERKGLGAGSSGRSGAILRQFYADTRLALMARSSLREYAGFEGLTARSIGFRRSGLLSIAGPARPSWIELLRAAHARIHDAGINVYLVGPAEMRSLIPGLRVDEGSLGVWEPEAGFVDPLKTVESFAALARTYGAITRLGVEARELRIEGGRITGVVAGDELFEAEDVIVCAGPWSQRLLAGAGCDLPLTVVRPETHFLRLPVSYHETMPGDEGIQTLSGVDLEDPLETISEQISGLGSIEDARIHPVIVDLEASFYARCEPEAHRTRVGRADYENAAPLGDPDDLDEEVGPESRAWAREVVSARMPVYGREPDVASQAAWYTLTPDAMPILGPMPGVEGLYAAVGFSGHGFKLAPSVGEGFAQLLRGDTVTAFDEELFAPTRFAEGRERVGSPFGL